MWNLWMHRLNNSGYLHNVHRLHSVFATPTNRSFCQSSKMSLNRSTTRLLMKTARTLSNQNHNHNHRLLSSYTSELSNLGRSNALIAAAVDPLISSGSSSLNSRHHSALHSPSHLARDLHPLMSSLSSLVLQPSRRSFSSLPSESDSLFQRAQSVLRLTTTLVQSGLLHMLYPVLFAKVPKGFEKFFPEETQQQEEKKTSPSTDKQSDDLSGTEPPDRRNGEGGGRNNNNGGRQTPQPPSSQALLMFLAFLLFCALISYSAENPAIRSVGSNKVTLQHFLNTLLARGYVQRVDIINKEVARVVLRPDCPAEIVPSHGQYSFRIGSVESFEAKLEAFQSAIGLHPVDFVPVQHIQEVDVLAEVLSYLPTFAVVAVSLFLLRRLASVGAANDPNKFLKMGRANPVSAKDVKVKVKFSDVAGMKEAKHEIKEFVDFLKDPKKYQQLGAHIPKGALLVGPPGTGKTLLAKAVAGEANVPFYSMSGSDFIEVFVGVGPSRVRDLFQQARKHSPCKKSKTDKE